MRTILAAAFAVAALSGAASAVETTKTVEVAFSARDLSEPARLDALRARIHRAAERACGAHLAHTFDERRAAAACAVEARQRAEAQLSQAVARVNGLIEVAAAR